MTETRKKKFFFNLSSDEILYIIELNLVSFFWTKTEFFPSTMKISQKVHKMEIMRKMSSEELKIFIPLPIFLVTDKKQR